MKRVLFVLIIASLVLAACEFDITADLYVQDLLDVQETGETLFTDATLALEFSGDEEDRQQVVDILSEHLHELENVRDEERDFSTFLVVDYQLPIVYAEDTDGVYAHAVTGEHMFTLALTADDTLNLAFNKTRFDAMATQLYDQFYQELTFEDSAMQVNLQNDLRDNVDVTLYSVYVDGVPIPFEQTITLERRDEIQIKFSDVLRDSVTTPLESETGDIVVRKFAEFGGVAE